MIVLLILGGSTFVISMCGSLDPLISPWFVPVLAILIRVANIVSVLGAIVDHLKPSVAIGIFCLDPLIRSSSCTSGRIGSGCTGRLEISDLLLQGLGLFIKTDPFLK